MPEVKSGFSEEYAPGGETAGRRPEGEVAPVTAPQEKIEQERYGVGKARRVVVRAKIAAD